MVIEKVKLRNVVDLSNEVHCWYFDEGNLQVIFNDV